MVFQQRSSTKSILVTGGLGFVGFQLCHALLAAHPNCKLTIVDNLCSTQINYQSLVGRADIHICDLRNYSAGSSRFDEIYHLASPVGSLEILKRHGYIATDILELAHKANELAAQSSAKLLYLSSSEVYGRDGMHGETADQIVPDRRGTRMEYALGKLTAEHVLFNLADKHGHSVRIVRPFNIIGPNQSDALGFVVPSFFKAAMNNEPLLVHGDGQQTRSFCAVNDLVAGMLAVQKIGHESTVYNAGNPGNKTTILELAETIKRLSNSSSDIALIDPIKKYGPRYLEAYNKMPAIERIKEHTGWSPKSTLVDILTDLHAYYEEPVSYKEARSVARSTANSLNTEVVGVSA